MNRLSFFALVGVVALGSGPFASSTAADMFGSGANSFEIEFVTIGQPGNPADTTGSPNPAGSVPYAYRIGKFEISEQMIDKANALGGLGISHDSRDPDKPATSVTWLEAAKFVNWLNSTKGSTPAYKFDSMSQFQLWEPGDAGYDLGTFTATVRPGTFCQASTSGTRRRTTIRRVAFILTTPLGAIFEFLRSRWPTAQTPERRCTSSTSFSRARQISWRLAG